MNQKNEQICIYKDVHYSIVYKSKKKIGHNKIQQKKMDKNMKM